MIELLTFAPWWALLVAGAVVLLVAIGLAAAWQWGTRSLREAVARREKFREVDLAAKRRINEQQQRRSA